MENPETPEEQELKLRRDEIEANRRRLEERRRRKDELAAARRAAPSFREGAVLKDVPLVPSEDDGLYEDDED